MVSCVCIMISGLGQSLDYQDPLRHQLGTETRPMLRPVRAQYKRPAERSPPRWTLWYQVMSAPSCCHSATQAPTSLSTGTVESNNENCLRLVSMYLTETRPSVAYERQVVGMNAATREGAIQTTGGTFTSPADALTFPADIMRRSGRLTWRDLCCRRSHEDAFTQPRINHQSTYDKSINCV